MMRFTLRQCLGQAAALLSISLSALAQPLVYPGTRQVDQVDTYHGQKVADPYRWLEDDNSADTRAWVQAQNRVTQAWFAKLPQREPTRQLLTELFDVERVGLPFKRGGRYFWTRNDGLQQQPVLYTAGALNETPIIALDPNTLSVDGTVALTATVPSPDGKLLAYGVASGGSDWQTWRVRDLATGRDLPDVLNWVKFTRATWTPDSRGFFYGRYDAPKEGAALTGANHFQKLHYHRLGTEQSADVLVAENPAEKTWMFGATVFDNSPRWLVITVSRDTSRRNGLMVLPLKDGAFVPGMPQPLTLAFDAQREPIALDGDTLFLRTNDGAPRSRIVSTRLQTGAAAPEWKPVVAEAAEAMVGASGVGGHFVLQYLRDASTVVRVHDRDGSLVREVALPGIGTASGFGGRWDDGETFFGYNSMTTPPEIHRYDIASGRATLFHRARTTFDSDRFTTRREFVTAKDGARVPIFIAHRKGLVPDGRQPTLLYGYGGFNQTMTPSYSLNTAAWLRMGGVFVIAAIRGGGEYGAAWHEAGTKLKKQNTFDDFIASAQWLIDNRWTNPSRLAVQGGSNGGLLVGAVVNQRPDLFAAAVPQVGVMDMLRFHKFTIGWAWASDYGSSDDAEQFKVLAGYSPLHNIRSGQRYPAVLVTTADHDDRVVPAHSFKYAAALQAADTGPAPKLIRIESRAGHGAGKPTSKQIDERADILAFVAHSLGLAVAPVTRLAEGAKP